jgi:hypothetical protein
MSRAAAGARRRSSRRCGAGGSCRWSPPSGGCRKAAELVDAIDFVLDVD